MLKKILLTATLLVSSSTFANNTKFFDIDFYKSITLNENATFVEDEKFYSVDVPENSYFETAIVHTGKNEHPFLIELETFYSKERGYKESYNRYEKLKEILLKKYPHKNNNTYIAGSYLITNIYGADFMAKLHLDHSEEDGSSVLKLSYVKRNNKESKIEKLL